MGLNQQWAAKKLIRDLYRLPEDMRRSIIQSIGLDKVIAPNENTLGLGWVIYRRADYVGKTNALRAAVDRALADMLL